MYVHTVMQASILVVIQESMQAVMQADIHAGRQSCRQTYIHVGKQIVGLLLSYVLATSKVISLRVPTCESTHSWVHYSAASLGDQATSMVSYSVTLT